MIIPKIPGLRHGMAYAKESMTKGQWVYLAGNFVAGDNPPTGPSKADVGDRAVLLAKAPSMFGKAGFLEGGQALPSTSLLISGAKAAPVGVYPVNRLIYKPENAELDEQTIASGDGCIYYEGGEYETDRYTNDSAWLTTAAFGDLLFLTHAAGLSKDPGFILSGYAVAYYISKTSAPDTGSGVIAPYFGNFMPTVGLVWYRVIAQ